MKKAFYQNPYFIIFCTYLLAHFFMLLLSGCWWDDWTFMSHNLNYISEVASQSGRPEWNILIPFCWSQPNNGRILIFFIYLFVCFFVYNILKECRLFNDNQSLIISLLFTIMPVDDARILISNFPYGVGLFFFYFSFMMFIRWNNSNKKLIYRILLLISFYFGFLLNSILVYYYLIFAYLFVIYFKESKQDNLILKALYAIKDILISYPDFFVLPFVYYGINKIFFPTHGNIFGSYNAMSVEAMLKCFLYIPKTLLSVPRDVLLMIINSFNLVTLVLLLIAIFIGIKVKQEDVEINYLKSLEYLVYGLVVFFLATFAYTMVRQSNIYIYGVKGRDAVLLPLAMSLIVYSFISLFKDRIQKIILSMLVVLGIFLWNNTYLEWQKDTYYQLSLENLLDNEVIRNNDTFFVTDLNETFIEAQRYYSLNANAYNVFNEETRLFMPKVSNLPILISNEELDIAVNGLDHAFMMKDYKPEDLNFDAVLDYYCDYTDMQVIELKLYELFNNDKFESIIKNNGTLNVVEVDDDFTYKLIQEYNEGKIKDDRGVLELLQTYAR